MAWQTIREWPEGVLLEGVQHFEKIRFKVSQHVDRSGCHEVALSRLVSRPLAHPPCTPSKFKVRLKRPARAGAPGRRRQLPT